MTVSSHVTDSQDAANQIISPEDVEPSLGSYTAVYKAV